MRKRVLLIISALTLMCVPAFAQAFDVAIWRHGEERPVYKEVSQIDSITFVVEPHENSTDSIPTISSGDLVIRPLSGEEQTYAVALIGSLLFHKGALYLHDKDGTELGHTPLAEIGKIVFKNEGDHLESTMHQSCLVYPNPSHDQLIICGIEVNQAVRIYSLQGVLLHSVVSKNDKTILDISDLQKGTYLLQIGAEIVTIIKQ